MDQPKLWGGAHRIILGAIAGSLLAAVLSVGWQGLDALAAPVGALADRAVWLQGLRTSYGMSAAVAVAALVLAWLSSRWKGAGERALSGTA